MLEGATAMYDFAVIILAKDDVMTVGQGAILKARDNCVFEAGLFMSALGRKRCFLANSVSQKDLPSDLGGVTPISFDEPADLADRSLCAKAIAKVAAEVKDIIQREGPLAYHARVPLLSVEEVFRRERPRSDGGDLTDGQVVVCDMQPWAEIGRAGLFRHNMDNGTSYHCFFYFCDDTIEKICQTLQMMAWAGLGDAGEANDFNTRTNKITKQKDRVLADLWDLCQSGQLRYTLMVEEPINSFRVHNASNTQLAKFYANYYSKGFAEWAEGPAATALWRSLPKYLEPDTADRLFLPLKYFALDDEKKGRLDTTLTRALSRYFSGIESEVKQIFLGRNS